MDVIYEPLDFTARLAALVPKPRVNLTRFQEVFAPNSKYRAQVTPAKRSRGGRLREGFGAVMPLDTLMGQRKPPVPTADPTVDEASLPAASTRNDGLFFYTPRSRVSTCSSVMPCSGSGG